MSGFERLLFSLQRVNSSFQAKHFRLTLDVGKEFTHMKNKTRLANLVLCGALAIATPLFAKPMSTNVNISHDVKVGQTSLKAGDYRFLIDGTHLTVVIGKQTVAEAEGKWEDRDNKASYTQIVSNSDGKLIELRFEGKKSVFVLNQ